MIRWTQSPHLYSSALPLLAGTTHEMSLEMTLNEEITGWYRILRSPANSISQPWERGSPLFRWPGLLQRGRLQRLSSNLKITGIYSAGIKWYDQIIHLLVLRVSQQLAQKTLKHAIYFIHLTSLSVSLTPLRMKYKLSFGMSDLNIICWVSPFLTWPTPICTILS